MFDPHLAMVASGGYTKQREEEEARRAELLAKAGPPPDPVPGHTWILDAKGELWMSRPDPHTLIIIDDPVPEPPRIEAMVLRNPRAGLDSLYDPEAIRSFGVTEGGGGFDSDRRPYRRERDRAMPSKKKQRKAQRDARRKNR